MTEKIFALRMRQGNPKGGGKGPLVQVNLSGTIGTVNDQTIFDKDERVYDMTHTDKAIVQHKICPPLMARMGTGGNQVPFRLEKELIFNGQGNASDTTSPTVVAGLSHSTGNTQIGVAVGVDVYNGTETADKAVTVTSASGDTNISGPKVMESYRVRRLLPVECERLQGFPDNWTQIPYRGKSAEDCPDSPRYKAIGNSWAVPCVRWIGRRIDAELRGAKAETTEVKKTSDEKTEEVIAIQGSVIGRAEKNGPQGQGYEQDGKCFTLTSADKHAVAYRISAMGSNSMKSSNPVSGINRVDLSPTLDTTGPEPNKSQGGLLILSEEISK